MMGGEWALFATVATAHALAVASPGPDFAVVVRQSLAFGRAAGLWTAAGIGSGIVVHVAYGLFGLAWLTQRHPQLLDALGYAGAFVLAWIGVGALRARPQTESGEALPPARPGDRARFFGIGLLTNVLNPKALLFFVALFAAVLTAPTSGFVKLVLGVWLPLATFAWFALVATLLGRPAARRRLRRAAHWIDRAMGVVLVGLAVVILVQLR
jgi:threonine/homoserine/homoserine lactone efflux protein